MNPDHQRLRALDGLRAVAVLAVLEAHVGYYLGLGGFLGVDVFFVLSGYLITRILVSEHGRFGNILLLRFYARRALRLYPALIAAAVLATAAPLAYDKSTSAVLSLTYLMDIARSAGLVTEAQVGPLGVTWSLAVEEHFYLVWPLVVGLVLSARVGRRSLPVVCVALALVAWLGLVVLTITGGDAVRLYFRPDLRSAALFVGCFIAVVPAQRWRGAARRGALPAALALLGLLQLARGNTGAVAYGLYFPATWVCTAIIIVAVQGNTAGLVGRVLALAPLVYVGRISYGIYLYHLIVITLVSTSDLRFSAKMALDVGVPVALAALSFRYLETPFLRIKDTRLVRADADRST